MNETPVIEVENVEKRFELTTRGPFWRRLAQALHAVDDVSLEIHPGEAVGLVGESGCGKSTLARVVSRLVDPTAGRIRMNGRDVTGLKTSSFTKSPLRREIQMVFQDPTESLNPRFTAFDLIADPIRQLMPPAGRGELQARVEAAADAVRLPLALLTRYPHQLSAGQKARVGIARAMAVEPKLLVLDEPTSALDVSLQATVLQLLDRLRREAGVALLFVSHDLNVVRLLCERILVMYLGQIVESGTTKQLFGDPRHPYTRALISAIPTLREGKRERIKLPGEPQSPVNPSPTMCRFYGRCGRQQDRCRQVAPLLVDEADGRELRCHFPHG
ncbi:ABC transporter ATP-binding protein [Arvimicrobium flavum]|uniref:ABC transporter ATP-binding protein n=1 Tax=Arvimicrobium flavum TaxID=3393320 RepID=UPI0030846A1B